MSYKAEIELCLNIHWFKNIQIDRQGYAAILVEIYDDSSPNMVHAFAHRISHFLTIISHDRKLLREWRRTQCWVKTHSCLQQ